MSEPKFLRDLEFIDEQSAGATSGDLPTDSVPNEKINQTRLGKILEEAQLATGATGAAIALVRGVEMVCCATAGPNAPGLWTCLDPSMGLSGLCIQTRKLQQCRDTELDPQVNLEACRRLGVRSIMVLPLLDSGELFGVFEILSSRPDAFGQCDLDSLRTLTDRILESKLPQREADATGPQRNHSVEPVQAELLARKVFMASKQRDSGARHSPYWMAIRTAAIVALAVLLGWKVGNASWKMAVERAENQPSRSSTR